MVSHHLGAGWWAAPIPAYMTQADWEHMLQTNAKIRAAPPTAAVPIPPMRVIPNAERFVESLTLSELQSIVLFLKGSLFDHVIVDVHGRAFATSYLAVVPTDLVDKLRAL